MLLRVSKLRGMLPKTKGSAALTISMLLRVQQHMYRRDLFCFQQWPLRCDDEL